jgi:hypothetical protein
MHLLTFLLAFLTLLANLTTSSAGETVGRPGIPGFPEGQGVYCRMTESGWTKLEPATISELKSEGIKRFIETAGLSTIYTTITYKGSKASIRVPDARPVFFVRGTGSTQDAIIVRLTQKKDSRETYTESDNTTYDNKGGYKTSEIQRLLITPYSKDAFSATPEEGLKPGEYLLTFGNTNVGFDFSVFLSAP